MISALYNTMFCCAATADEEDKAGEDNFSAN